jgi:hypothetical protein
MAEDERKAELTAELARSRTQITGQWSELRRDLDFVTRARRAFSRHPAVWIGGAVLLGLFIARLPAGRKKAAPAARRRAEPTIEKVEKAGLLQAGLKFAFNLARPALTAWITRRATEYFEASNRGDTRRR